MNLANSVSFSESESDKYLFDLIKRRSHNWCIFLLVHRGIQLMLGMNQGRNSFALAETGIQYQYTRVRFRVSANYRVLLLNNLTVVKSLSLNTIDPHPPPSSTYKIKGWELFYQNRLRNTVGRKTIIYELGHDGTSRLIGSSLSDRLSDQIRAKVVCLQVNDPSVAGSMTAQPPGFCPTALQVATHG